LLGPRKELISGLYKIWLNSWLVEWLFVSQTLCRMELVVLDIYFTVLNLARWVPVTTALWVIKLWMDERHPAMEGSCECVE
jgi:hypothetical protein